MATKSVQRTMDLLSNAGMSAYVVERFNPYGGRYGIREDFMGFIDIIAMTKEHGIVGVQACGQDWGSHVKKMTEERRSPLDTWTEAGGKTWLIGWRKLKQRLKSGKMGKQKAWVPRVAIWSNSNLVELKPEMLYICPRCATKFKAEWPEGHCATVSTGLCGHCMVPGTLASIDDWDWPKGSEKPGPGAGRD